MVKIKTLLASRLFRSGHAYSEIHSILSMLPMKGPCLDLPAGTGVNFRPVQGAGFEYVGADLYPEYSLKNGIKVIKADFSSPLPFRGEQFAAVLHSEGIEHCPCQLQLLNEFWRVLAPGGAILITTPNILSFRARLSFLLNGHYSFAHTPTTETSQIWDSTPDGRTYIGHVFCTSYFSIRFMLNFAGFEDMRVTTAKYSPSSLLLAPILWLPVRLATGHLLKKSRPTSTPALIREVLTHVMSPALLLGKKLIVLAKKPVP